MEMAEINLSVLGRGYRYGFNGKENDKEWGDGMRLVQDYGFRLYSPAIGKFLRVDPLTKGYVELTPYQFASNTPIQAIDLDGLEALIQRNWYQVDGNGNTVLTYSVYEDVKPENQKMGQGVLVVDYYLGSGMKDKQVYFPERTVTRSFGEKTQDVVRKTGILSLGRKVQNYFGSFKQFFIGTSQEVKNGPFYVKVSEDAVSTSERNVMGVVKTETGVVNDMAAVFENKKITKTSSKQYDSFDADVKSGFGNPSVEAKFYVGWNREADRESVEATSVNIGTAASATSQIKIGAFGYSLYYSYDTVSGRNELGFSVSTSPTVPVQISHTAKAGAKAEAQTPTSNLSN